MRESYQKGSSVIHGSATSQAKCGTVASGQQNKANIDKPKALFRSAIVLSEGNECYYPRFPLHFE